jgi:hypothetical protein
MVEENTVSSIVVELSALAERAEQACGRTSDLVSDYRFIVEWYRTRPRSRLRTVLILDES